jgi:hypothetical protein
MNNYEEIKNLLKASKNLLGGVKLVNEEHRIKSQYGIITEEDTQINPMKDIEKKIQSDIGNNNEQNNKDEKKRAYRISGGILVIHGRDEDKLQLTTDDKTAFQETMDEFLTDVAKITDFNKLNVYENNVEWSGKITEMDIEFYMSIGENNGVYINGDMIKLDEEFTNMVTALKTYYEKFKSKWSKVITDRKKTK